MMLLKPLRKAVTPKPDEVDRTVASVRSAIGRLARLVCSSDPQVALKAAKSLREIGIFAGGPVASTLSRAPDPRHRLLMLFLLQEIGTFADPAVIKVLMHLAKQDPHIMVSQQAGLVLSNLIDR